LIDYIVHQVKWFSVESASHLYSKILFSSLTQNKNRTNI